MADFELSLGADTSEMKSGEKALDSFADEAERTERRTKKATDEMGESFSRSSSVVTSASRRMGGAIGRIAVAAISAFGSAQIVRTLSTFESSVARMGAISRATADDLELMRDTASQLGATTEFTASQAADGLTFLAMAGFDARESVTTIPAVLDLATASMMGLGQTADITSNIMSGFGIGAQESARVADVLAAASTRANTDVAQLGEAMSTAAPIAASLGIDLEETASAIGAMSDAGIQGSRAGTALRGVLASLAGPTTQATDALAKYGLTAADVDIETHGLTGVLETLRGVGLSTADAMTIFGREAASGALVMIDASERVRGLTDELNAASGAASEMADKIRDNLGGDLESLGSSVQGLILAMGDAGLTAVIRTTVQAVTGLTRAITSGIEKVVELKGYVIAGALALTTAYLPAIVTVTGAIVSSTIATGAWIASLVTLKGALITTGIGAVVVVAGTLINKFFQLSERVGGFGKALGLLKNIAVAVFTGMGDTASAFGDRFIAVGQDVMAAWSKVLQWLAQKWANFVGSVGSTFNEITAVTGGPQIDTMGVQAWASSFDGAVVRFEKRAEDLRRVADEKVSGAFRGAAQAVQVLRESMVDIESTFGPESEGAGGAPGVEGETTVGGAGADLAASGGGGGAAGALADKLAGDLERLKESLATEREVLAEWYSESLQTLIDARNQQMLTEEEFRTLRERLEAEHLNRMSELNVGYTGTVLDNTEKFFGGMAKAFAKGGEKTAKITRVFSAVEALINTYRAASQTLADPSLPFWMKIPAAASIIGAGMGFVSAIKSGSSGGGGSGARGGSVGRGPQASPVSQPDVTEPPLQTMNFTVVNDSFGIGENLVRQIVGQINEASRNGMTIRATVAT